MDMPYDGSLEQQLGVKADSAARIVHRPRTQAQMDAIHETNFDALLSFLKASEYVLTRVHGEVMLAMISNDIKHSRV